MLENNLVSIIGTIVGELIYNHEVYGEKFYFMEIQVERLSQISDLIPVMVSEKIVDIKKSYVGKLVEIQGQFRSYNRQEENKNYLILYVFAKEICFLKQEREEVEETKSNYICLNGYICKTPTYRRTPFGREIADIILAVNRPYGKSDYIPCIAWGRNARYATTFEVGSKVSIWGRVQSRKYVKKIGENQEKRTAYEVSISTLQIYGEQQNEKAI